MTQRWNSSFLIGGLKIHRLLGKPRPAGTFSRKAGLERNARDTASSFSPRPPAGSGVGTKTNAAKPQPLKQTGHLLSPTVFLGTEMSWNKQRRERSDQSTRQRIGGRHASRMLAGRSPVAASLHQRAEGRRSRSRSDGTPKARDGVAGMPEASGWSRKRQSYPQPLRNPWPSSRLGITSPAMFELGMGLGTP
jgi:hypothetical protein